MSGRGPLILISIVMISGAALLVAGLTSLWQAARDAELIAERESQVAAEGIAEDLRRQLQTPAFQADVAAAAPADRTVTIAQGEIVPGSLVAWLEEPSVAELNLHWKVRDALREAARLEFRDGDPDAGLKVIREAVRDSDLDPRDRAALHRGEAWVLVRRKSDEVRPTLDAAAEQVSAIPDPALRDHFEFELDLCRLALGMRLDDEAKRAAEARLLRSHPTEARIQLERLAERDPKLAESFRNALTEAETRRAFLQKVGAALPSFLHESSFAWRAFDGAILFWQPELSDEGETSAAGANGMAYVISRRDVAEILAQDRHQLNFHFGENQPAKALTIAPGLALLPTVGEGSGGSRTGLLTWLLLLVALVFAFTLFWTIRAVRREALAARARADFLTSVTHELKTPLASIRLLAEMLEDGRVASQEKRAQYHKLLSGESARLSMLIENVLDLGRLERGERAYVRREEEIDDVLRDTVELFRPVAARDGLELSMKLEDVSSRGKIDRGALVQAILNLLENARKYAISGGKLVINGHRRDGRYEFSVRDFGPGIPDEERQAIFERFQRGERQKDGSIPGVGLGLYLARTIIRDHGGDLSADTPEDGGPGIEFRGMIPELSS